MDDGIRRTNLNKQKGVTSGTANNPICLTDSNVSKILLHRSGD